MFRSSHMSYPLAAGAADGPPAIAWMLLAAGVLLLLGCGVLAWWSKRRKPEPPKTPAQLWTETDRYYSVEDPPEHGQARELSRRPLFYLAGMAVLAVVALAAGVTLLIDRSGSETAATSSGTPQAVANPGIVATGTDLCLTAEYVGDGAPVALRTCQGSETQQWQPGADGTLRIGTRCMDVAGAETKIGTIIQLADCNGNAAQLFRFEGGKLISGLAGNCVDARAGQLTVGADVVIQRCAAVGRRTWTAPA